MAKLQGAVAKFQTIAEDLPEAFFVFATRASHIDKVNGDDALIEAAVVFWLTIIVFRPSNVIETIASLIGR